MATVNETVMREQFRTKLKENLYLLTPELGIFFEKGMMYPLKSRTGKFPLVVQRNQSGGAFANLSPIVTQQLNPYVTPTFTAAQFYETLTLADDEQWYQEAGGLGNENLVNDYKAQFENIEMTMKAKIIENGIYGTSDTIGALPNILGLPNAIGTSRTYLGINSATYTLWNSYVESTACTDDELTNKATLSKYLPHLMRVAVQKTLFRKPADTILTTDDLYVMYLDIVGEKFLVQSNGTANLGFDRAKFSNGADIVPSKNCTAKAMYFLNSEDWVFTYLPGKNFDFVKNVAGTSIWEKIPGALGRTATMVWVGQLYCERPRAQGKLTGKGS